MAPIFILIGFCLGYVFGKNVELKNWWFKLLFSVGIPFLIYGFVFLLVGLSSNWDGYIVGSRTALIFLGCAGLLFSFLIFVRVKKPNANMEGISDLKKNDISKEEELKEKEKVNMGDNTYLIICLLYLFGLCSFGTQQVKAQQAPPSNWAEYRIPNICTFAIPPTMELRDRNSMFGQVHDAIRHSPYWEWVCDECDLFNGDFNLAFQPKGINKMDVSRNNPFSTFARILVNFRRVTKDDINEEMLLGLSAQDKKEYSAYAEELIKQKFNCTDQLTPGYMTGKFEWNPVQFTTIDGVLCLIYDFIRPGHNAQTHVRSYEFYKGDYFIEFILSYNQNDAKLYKSDLESFIKYLHFDNTFKQNKYKSPSSNKSSTFKSIVHNIQYTYDVTMFRQEKINNAPHMLLKLQSTKDDFSGVTLAAFNNLDLTGYNAHHSDVVEYFKEYDNQMRGVQNGGYTTIIESCTKVTIGNNVKALRTKSKTTYNAYNVTMYAVIYRFVNGSELQTLNLFLSSEDYAQFSELEKTITKGISFIK